MYRLPRAPRTPRSHRLTPNRLHSRSDMILPALVCQVLRNAYGDLVDIEASAIIGSIPVPERSPSIRVRPRGAAWTAGGRMIGTLLVLSFDHYGDPMVIDPRSLVDRDTGYVLPEYMAGLAGVSLRVRNAGSVNVARRAVGPSHASHIWSTTATLGGAA